VDEPLLSIKKVSHSFQGAPVLIECSSDFHSGEIVLLLGANGAGKSTLLRIVSGLLRPESGTIVRGATLCAKGLSYHAHQLMLYGELTVKENLQLFSEILGDVRSIDEDLSEWGLSSHRHISVNRLSKGLQARVSLARGFSGSRAMYLLDEPSSTLDDVTSAKLCKMIHRKSSEGALVIVATHDLARLASIATRAMVLSEGQIRCDSGIAATAGTDPVSTAQSEGVLRAMNEYRGVNR
jgi:ABC-type multidrug transport system ATPase subunit